MSDLSYSQEEGTFQPTKTRTSRTSNLRMYKLCMHYVNSKKLMRVRSTEQQGKGKREHCKPFMGSWTSHYNTLFHLSLPEFCEARVDIIRKTSLKHFPPCL